MKKRMILLLMIGVLVMSILTSCALMRQPWPAGETMKMPAATDIPPRGNGSESEPTATPATTTKPVINPVTDPDFNG